MPRKRFLRDGILQSLQEEAKNALERLPQDDESFHYVIQYLNSILVSYETSRITLERIEETIEIARPKDPTGEIWVPLCEASTHIKSGIFTLHENLCRNLEPYREEMHIDFNEFEALVQDNFLA